MKTAELDEAVALAQRVLTALLATLPSTAGTAGATLKFAVGALNAALPAKISAATPAPYFVDCANCFELARGAGASYAAFDAVRILALGFSPVAPAAIAVANFAVRLALVEQARILAVTTFANRDDVDRALDQVADAFDAAVMVAADRHDSLVYRALTALRAAVINDLTSRALPLPRRIDLSFATRFPALALAQRIYQDPTRAAELIAGNRVVHPAFMPYAIRALSN